MRYYMCRMNYLLLQAYLQSRLVNGILKNSCSECLVNSPENIRGEDLFDEKLEAHRVYVLQYEHRNS